MGKYNVDKMGFYGNYGGAYVPEILYKTVENLKESYEAIIDSDEFRKEFDTLKASFEAELKALKTENESLKSQNTDLQRALIRSATVPENPAPAPKTEEQLYAEKIDALAKKTLQRMCKS